MFYRLAAVFFLSFTLTGLIGSAPAEACRLFGNTSQASPSAISDVKLKRQMWETIIDKLEDSNRLSQNERSKVLAEIDALLTRLDSDSEFFVATDRHSLRRFFVSKSTLHDIRSAIASGETRLHYRYGFEFMDWLKFWTLGATAEQVGESTRFQSAQDLINAAKEWGWEVKEDKVASVVTISGFMEIRISTNENYDKFSDLQVFITNALLNGVEFESAGYGKAILDSRDYLKIEPYLNSLGFIRKDADLIVLEDGSFPVVHRKSGKRIAFLVNNDGSINNVTAGILETALRAKDGHTWTDPQVREAAATYIIGKGLVDLPDSMDVAKFLTDRGFVKAKESLPGWTIGILAARELASRKRSTLLGSFFGFASLARKEEPITTEQIGKGTYWTNPYLPDAVVFLFSNRKAITSTEAHDFAAALQNSNGPSVLGQFHDRSAMVFDFRGNLD